MACPEENVSFWPAELWDIPLDTIQTGILPIIWSTGQLPNPAGGDADPWLGRLVPDRMEWIGGGIEITFNGGMYERGQCLTPIPPLLVRIQGFCYWGVNNITIEVRAKNRFFYEHFSAFNGSFDFFGNVLFTEPCARKYAVEGVEYRFDIRHLRKWLDICLEYSLNTLGSPSLWWQIALQIDAADTDFIPCSGCEYGFLETDYGLVTNEDWDDLQLDVFPIGIFPLLRNIGQVKIQACNNIVLVVDTDTGDADRYIKTSLTCDQNNLVRRSQLFIEDECFIDEPDEPDPIELPDDEDPRWKKPAIPANSCYRSHYDSYAGTGDLRRLYEVGRHEGHPPLSAIPSTLIPQIVRFDPYIGANGYQYYYQQHINRSFTTFKYRTEFKPTSTGGFETIKYVEVEDHYMDYHLDQTTNASNIATNNAAIAKLNAFSQARQAYLQSPAGCDAKFIFDNNGFPPPPPPMERPEEERLNLDGKCFVKGQISIGIKYNVEFVRVFQKLGPEVQEWAIKKTIPMFIPTAIRIPFKFQLPQGSTTIGGTSVTLTGTFVQIGVGSESMIINIEEIFAYYNLVDDSGILGFLIPGPISITNLESFCEL